MHLGRHRQGGSVTLRLLATGAKGAPATVASCPTARVYSAAGSLLATVRLPPASRTTAGDLFAAPLRLGGSFPAGRYVVAYSYVDDATTRKAPGSFEVLPGGNQYGPVIALHQHDRPEARYVLAHVGSGHVLAGRNPRVP